MFDVPSLREESRYGMPAADRLLFNRRYVVGYSYLFRQPRWALELINRHTKQMADKDLKRLNNFREDPRVPEMFRSTSIMHCGVHRRRAEPPGAIWGTPENMG